MKDNIVKGQAFIGRNDEKYFYLGLTHDGNVLFTDIDNWLSKEKKYMEKENIFIKEVLEEYDEVIRDSSFYYQNNDELLYSTMEEKIKRCLDNIKDSNTSDFELKPIEIGNLVSGQAYYEEENQFYEVIGFVVENEVYLDGKYNGKQKGFFAIYHSACSEIAPMNFELPSGKDNQSYMNSNGSKVDVKAVILPHKETLKEDIEIGR